ncbi:hypothetical protein K431DRAFT_285300 [Polychaeton citri CBS 116435]|uniref:Complex I intermediate-associated protein 84 n=1 Tax=Polychaeton citri CBS 116435 TaxID=1314669 RepID=A0A9P4Q776_9PEZI|nr:hypothetical protein K431DRAFT_285300 [Polychaeton citri CBS 116435]
MATSRSALTPYIFRRILANEPIVHRDCTRKLSSSCSTGAKRFPILSHQRTNHPRNAYPLLARQQRRHLFSFNLFHKAPTQVRDPDLDPGVEVMQHYAKMERLKSRLPPVEEVAEAWTSFFKYRKSKKKGVEDIHARLALQNLKYIVGQGRADGTLENVLGSQPLTNAIWVVRATGDKVTDAHVDLISFIRQLLPSSTALAFSVHVATLTKSGRPKEARDEILQFDQTQGIPEEIRQFTTEEIDDLPPAAEPLEVQATSRPTSHRLAPWLWVLRGFSKAGDEANLMETLTMMSPIFKPELSVAAAVLDFYATRNGAAYEPIQKWWRVFDDECASQNISKKQEAMVGRTVDNVLRWCVRNDKLDFGHSVVRDAMSNNPPKSVWDATFVWAAGLKKGVEEIGRMLSVMEQSNQSIADREAWRIPDSETINTLIDFAIQRNDPYLAERFINLGRDHSINPNSRTYVLQMEYRLRTDDIDGALTAYKNLQAQDSSTMDDIPVVNRLVAALCSSKRHDFDTIMNVVADMSDRRAGFEPLTVSKLAVLHLSRGEIDDVLDLLNTHAVHYSSTGRSLVRETLINFCTDVVGTNTNQAWGTYGILTTTFEEMTRPQRTEIMLSFFARKRSDMAVNVFNHMRAHTREDTIPTIDTYISTFKSIAELKESEPLEIVHNQLKLDYNINHSTKLYNILIVAYTACGGPRTALSFWDDIVASREGPTYESIHIALRACEHAPFGDYKAQEIWRRLERTNIDLDQSLWSSYLAAIVGNGEIDVAFKIFEEAVDSGKLKPDAFLLASMFSASRNPFKQQDVESRIQASYPEIWKEIEDRVGIQHVQTEIQGQVVNSVMREAKIDRSVSL